MKQMTKILLAGLLAGASLHAESEPVAKPETTKQSQSPVEVTTRSLQLKTIKTPEGKKVKKWVRATEVVPGDTVRYVNTVRNRSSQKIEKVRIVNPINPHLVYLARSAKCAGGCTIRFSIDGGKHFAAPKELFVKMKNGKKRLALPKEYNAVEWVIDAIPAGKKTTVEFKARLK
ncbi:hypothetical protein [Nitratifractor sp.]